MDLSVPHKSVKNNFEEQIPTQLAISLYFEIIFL